MTVTIDYSGFKRKAKLIEQKIKQSGEATIKELCQLGKNHAKSIAPMFSGTLISAISYKTSKGTSGEVYIKALDARSSYSTGFKNTVQLAEWMHKTNGILPNGVSMSSNGKFYVNPNKPSRGKHIISGSPRFMTRTKDYMNKIKTSVAKGHFDKIKIQ